MSPCVLEQKQGYDNLSKANLAAQLSSSNRAKLMSSARVNVLEHTAAFQDSPHLLVNFLKQTVNLLCRPCEW